MLVLLSRQSFRSFTIITAMQSCKPTKEKYICYFSESVKGK